MHYPSIARSVLGSAGFAIHISGRRKDFLLATCDRFFGGPRSVSIGVGDVTLHLDMTNPAERLLYYAPTNLLLSYIRSPLFSIMSRLAVPNGVFVDIGANLGLYSLLARRLGFKTLLFEPEPTHYAFLSRNEEVIGTPVPCALSDQTGTAEFFVSGETNPGSSSLVMPEGGWSQSEYERTISVRLCTLDNALNELDVDPTSIRLLKIDVEGNEERTVLGMTNYLAGRAPAPIWCEVRGSTSGRGRNSVFSVTNALTKFGYCAFRFQSGSLFPFHLGKDPAPQVFDLLFAIPAHHSKALSLQL
jgi:FkbM family methyltransferase